MSLFDRILGDKKSLEEFEQSEEEKKLVTYVRNKAEECRMTGSRVAHESTWLTNVAYCLGIDAYFNSTTRRFETNANANASSVRRNFYINKILPTIQNRAARLIKNKPKYDNRPMSNDPEDKEAARLGLQILDYVWENQNLERKRVETIMWLQQCGHCYLHVSFDDCLGDPMVDPASGEVIGYEGDIRVDVSSAFEIFADPLAKNFDEANSFLRVKVRPLDYFQKQYGDLGAQVKPDGAFMLSSQFESRINTLTTNSRGMTGNQVALKNVATEMTYYEKRSKDYPMGRMIIVAGDILLENKPLPIGEIPIVKFDDIVVGGKFFGEAVVTHMRPIQDQFNRLYKKRAQWVNQLLAGKYLTAKGHELTKEALNDQSGEILSYTPVPNASEPHSLETPNIPSYAYKEEEALQSQLDDVSGINEVSRGSLPSAQVPAIGMQFLEEQDSTRIGIEVSNHEEGYARLGRLILLFAQKCYKTSRLLKIGGNGLEYTIKSFQGSDIRGNTDVTVIKGSSLPGSKVLKRQEVLNLFTQGLLGDPQDPKVREKVLNLIEFGNVSEVWVDFALDSQQIKKQIEMIEKGLIPEINELDNHTLAIQELNRYRKTEKFERLSPLSQQILMDQIHQHIDMQSNINHPELKFQDQQMELERQGTEDQLNNEHAAQAMQEQQMGQPEMPQAAPQPVGGPEQYA